MHYTVTQQKGATLAKARTPLRRQPKDAKLMFRLPLAMKQQAETYADKTDTSVSWVLTQALKEYLAKRAA